MLECNRGRERMALPITGYVTDSKSLTAQDLHFSIYKITVLVIISIVQYL